MTLNGFWPGGYKTWGWESFTIYGGIFKGGWLTALFILLPLGFMNRSEVHSRIR